MSETVVTDPVRRVFETTPGCFHLGGRLSPISIRDQIIRACLVVDRIHACGLIKENKPVAVIGAGIAGMAAALRSAERGTRTLLIDAGTEVAQKQRGCSTRIIDPTLYDWPVAHWKLGTFPIPKTPDVPFPWSSGRPEEIAWTWKAILEKNLTLSRHFRFLPMTTIVGAEQVEGEGIRLRAESSGSQPVELRESFSCAILASGFGAERTGAPSGSFRGYEFWDVDPLERTNAGVGMSPTRGASVPRVFLAGGGDGALQDLFRLVLANPSGVKPFSTKAFLDALIVHGNEDGVNWDKVQAEVSAVEDQAIRSLIWSPHNGKDGYDDEFDRKVVSRLNDAYEDILLDAFKSPYVPPRMRSEIDRWQRPDRPSLVFALRRTTFPPCFGVNRLLGQILQRYYARESGHQVQFLLGTEVLSVDGVDHQCEGAPDTCHGRPHLVKYTQKGVTKLETFDVVILRFGIKYTEAADALKSRFGPVFPERQMMPFHLP